MCAELTAARAPRLIVPTVYRNEYLAALRGLSREGRCELYVRTLRRAWQWTAAMPWHDRAAVDGLLERTHAVVDSSEAEGRGIRLEVP